MQLLQGPKAEHKVEFCRLLLDIEKVEKKKSLGRMLQIYSLIDSTFYKCRVLKTQIGEAVRSN